MLWKGFLWNQFNSKVLDSRIFLKLLHERKNALS